MSEGLGQYQKPPPFNRITNEGVSFPLFIVFLAICLVINILAVNLALDQTIEFFTGRTPPLIDRINLSIWIAIPLTFVAVTAAFLSLVMTYIRK
jgi:hypothetical protein